MEDIIFALFLVLLFYGIPALTMASQSINHYKKAKQRSDFVITDCARCHSNNLSPIQDVSQNVKEYRSFIIKSFIAFIVFEILHLGIAFIFEEILKEILNPFQIIIIMDENFNPELWEKAQLFYIMVKLTIPIKYILLFFSVLNSIAYFYFHSKYDTKEIHMVCHNCGYINRPQNDNEEAKNESNEENHS